MLPRSFLYVPGNRPDLFDKAANGPADAIVLDLEDAVPLPAKADARDAVRRWLDALEPGPDTAEVWVRVDPLGLDADLDAVLHPHLDGLFLAGCTPDVLTHLTAHEGWSAAPRWSSRASAEDLRWSSRASASEPESRPGDVPPNPHPLRVVGLVESAEGLLALQEMAAHPALTAFGVGEVDLLGDLRVARTHRTEAVVAALRTQVVLHSAAAGLEAPVAPTSTDFRDLDAFAEGTRLALDLGFRSRTAIHPAQVPVIHDVLTPTAEQVDAARDVVDRYEAAGSGVTTDAAGRLIDAAVVRAARETLARA